MPNTRFLRHVVPVIGVIVSAVIADAGCSIHPTDVPPLTGPSELALAIGIAAAPTVVSQDGSSTSTITVTARGVDGLPKANVTVRVDMALGCGQGQGCPNGHLQDFGTLNQRTVFTGPDGAAQTVFTAPASLPAGTLGSGSITTLSMLATPKDDASGSFDPSRQVRADIRLVPAGVILPPATPPTPAFTITPTPVTLNVPTNFDASASCGGAVTNGVCDNSNPIVSYDWTFGDGSQGSGRIVSHSFTSVGTFTVKLTVTNSRGFMNATTQTVAVAPGTNASGDFTWSPNPSPNVNDTVLFNADAIRAPAGHTIVQYSWNFGDPNNLATNTASGATVSHVFTAAETYNVVLNVTDDTGQRTTFTHAVVIGTGNPKANLVLVKTGGFSVTADGGTSTAASGSIIRTYTFTWVDGNGVNTITGNTPLIPITFSALGTYTVRLTVTDTLNRTDSTSQTITVP